MYGVWHVANGPKTAVIALIRFVTVFGPVTLRGEDFVND